MGTLTLDKKRRKKRIVVAKANSKRVPRKTEPALAEKKARAAINIAKEQKQMKARRLAIRAMNKKLKESYPVWEQNLPLHIGAGEELREKYVGELSKRAMRELVGSHCQKRKYFENTIEGKRYNLFTGEAVEEISRGAIDRAQKMIDGFERAAGRKRKSE